LRLVSLPIVDYRKVEAAGRAVFCTPQKSRQDEAVKQPTPFRVFCQIPPFAAKLAEHTPENAVFWLKLARLQPIH